MVPAQEFQPESKALKTRGVSGRSSRPSLRPKARGDPNVPFCKQAENTNFLLFPFLLSSGFQWII